MKGLLELIFVYHYFDIANLLVILLLTALLINMISK